MFSNLKNKKLSLYYYYLKKIRKIFPNQGTEVSIMAIVGILAAWNGSAKQNGNW